MWRCFSCAILESSLGASTHSLLPGEPSLSDCRGNWPVSKASIFGMVIYWTGIEETWWFTDRFSDSHTARCTQTNTNVLLAKQGNLYEKVWSEGLKCWGNFKWSKETIIIFPLCFESKWCLQQHKTTNLYRKFVRDKKKWNWSFHRMFLLLVSGQQFHLNPTFTFFLTPFWSPPTPKENFSSLLVGKLYLFIVH